MQAWGGQYLGGTLINAVAFAVLVIVLVVRPEGLLGKPTTPSAWRSEVSASAAQRWPSARARRWPASWSSRCCRSTSCASSEQRTVAGVFMFVALAQGWNLIGGFAGYPSFGQVVFFGLGGYTTAILMAKSGVAFWVALPAAAVVGVVFAILVGLPVLRLRGHYFAIATLGVAEGMREVVVNLDGLTGGNSGITVPAVGADAATSYPGNTGFYFYFLALALFATAVVWLVARSRFGYGLRAIAQDEDAAAAAGHQHHAAEDLRLRAVGLPHGDGRRDLRLPAGHDLPDAAVRRRHHRADGGHGRASAGRAP